MARVIHNINIVWFGFVRHYVYNKPVCSISGGQGEGSWVLTYAVVQSIPFSFFLHLTGLEHILHQPSTFTLVVLASLSNGLWLTLTLIIAGSIWNFFMKAASSPTQK